MYRKCSTCKKDLPFSNFSKRSDKKDYSIDNPAKYKSRCKPCESLWAKAGSYGVSIEELISLKEDSEDCCSICGVHESEVEHGRNVHYGLYVDHCHDSGKVRGWLCYSCNLMIGHAKDNIGNLESAINYLRKHQDMI